MSLSREKQSYLHVLLEEDKEVEVEADEEVAAEEAVEVVLEEGAVRKDQKIRRKLLLERTIQEKRSSTVKLFTGAEDVKNGLRKITLVKQLLLHLEQNQKLILLLVSQELRPAIFNGLPNISVCFVRC